MSFTEDKFERLSHDNRLKKVVYAIKEYLHDRKPYEYVYDLLQWFNKYEGWSLDMPADGDQWRKLAEELLEVLYRENPFIEKEPFDMVDKERMVKDFIVILDDIRSPYNVGSIFRTAEGFGVKQIVLTGITPTPETNSKVNKTACKARVDYTYRENILESIVELSGLGYVIVALEKTPGSLDITTVDFDEPVALVLGNEEFGVAKEVLEKCDRIVHITMSGVKNSLNVSVATGIALFEINNKLS